MAASISAPPLLARSSDGSLIGIHHPVVDPSSNSKTGLIRCYDGSVSNGSLKFTLRFPLTSSSDGGDGNDGLPSGVPGNEKREGLDKLVFATGFLCGMRLHSSSILLWDLDRGVLSRTIDVRSADAAPKKKKRKSSLGGGNEILCDVASAGDQLYALVFFPEEDGNGGKCRVYHYDLTNEASLKRKIKVGSVPSNENDGQPVFGVAISDETMVVRMGSHLRVNDVNTGEKLCKIDLPSISLSAKEEGDSKYVPLSVSPDGRHIAAATGNKAVLLSCAKEGDKRSLQTLAVLSGKDDSPIDDLSLTISKDEVSAVAFQPDSGMASLFTISAKSASKVPQAPKAHLKTDEDDKSLSLIGAGFHPRNPDESLLLLFQRTRHGGGSAAGSGTSLPMEVLPYSDGALEGTVTVGKSLAADEAKGRDKKRKAGSSIALAPGDQGQEASGATDLSQKKKRAKKTGNDDEEAEEEDEFQLEDEEGDGGQTIAERLALLSSAMEQTDDEDEEETDEEEDETKAGGGTKKFRVKSATSATLTALLTQALSSNDSSQLNVALQVTDRRLVEGTVRSLQDLDARRPISDTNTPGYVPTLMAHIVRRMARRHSLVMPLGVWVRAILAATARSATAQALGGHNSSEAEERMAREAREMASKLGPLKNFLEERVECFPQLLRLEGRLALLGQGQL